MRHFLSGCSKRRAYMACRLRARIGVPQFMILSQCIEQAHVSHGLPSRRRTLAQRLLDGISTAHVKRLHPNGGGVINISHLESRVHNYHHPPTHAMQLLKPCHAAIDGHGRTLRELAREASSVPNAESTQSISRRIQSITRSAGSSTKES